ncbi:hypothetical protein HUS66_09250 [Halomonas taeanensis]|nr:hypothetical protein [Halomonas taeanensis]
MPGQPGDACHLLAWHSLDVAAVGWHLLSPERPLTQQLALRLGIEPEPLRRLLHEAVVEGRDEEAIEEFRHGACPRLGSA